MIRVSTDIFCDVCGNWAHGTVGDKVDARKTRETAKYNGWERGWSYTKRKYIDYCPTCVPPEYTAVKRRDGRL